MQLRQFRGVPAGGAALLCGQFRVAGFIQRIAVFQVHPTQNMVFILEGHGDLPEPLGDVFQCDQRLIIGRLCLTGNAAHVLAAVNCALIDAAGHKAVGAPHDAAHIDDGVHDAGHIAVHLALDDAVDAHTALHAGTGGELVFQAVAVHGFDVGKALDAVHFVMALQLGDHGLLHAVVRFRGHKGHIVGRRKVFVDHVAGDLHIVQLGSLDAVQAVGIGAQAGEMIGDQHQHQKDRRDDLAGLVGKSAHEWDLGHKALVLGLFHPGAKDHQKARHDEEHRQNGVGDGLDEADGHIRADLELHEHHGHQTAHGGQTAGRDLRDALGQRFNDRFLQRQGLVFLTEVVGEDDGVVQRQRQLQNARDRVGHEGNGAEQKVRTAVEHHGNGKGEQQHGDLGVGLRGENQQNHHDQKNQVAPFHDLTRHFVHHIVFRCGLFVHWHSLPFKKSTGTG